ncbi:MAG: MBOAT family protein, partial [Lentisphaeria bacterium]|nr:MBOAT family protein [Lentisphaeria bacterium]
WHGASWNFLIWGGIHGGYLAFERFLGKESLYRRFPKLIQVTLTFFIVLIAWVFFRADSLPEAWRYLGCMFGWTASGDNAPVVRGLTWNLYYVSHFVLAGLVVWGLPQSWDFTRKLTWAKLAWCIAVFLIALAALTTQSYNPFIYFIF